MARSFLARRGRHGEAWQGLTTRGNLAHWRGEAGPAERAAPSRGGPFAFHVKLSLELGPQRADEY